SASIFIFFFFFQAEDGIRYRNVTGVQTCALPISSIIFRKRVTGISFPYDPHYVSCSSNLSAYPRGRVRRASGLVLVAYPQGGTDSWSTCEEPLPRVQARRPRYRWIRVTTLCPVDL